MLLRFSLRQSLVLWAIASLLIIFLAIVGSLRAAEAQLLIGANDGVYLREDNENYYFFNAAALPLWSPDGELVALQAEHSFYLSDKTSRVHYSLNLAEHERFVYRPIWAEDSQRIALLKEEAIEGQYRLLIIDCLSESVSDYSFPSAETVLLWWETAAEIRFVTANGRQIILWAYELGADSPTSLQTWRFPSYMQRNAVLNPDKQGFVLPAITTTVQNFELYAFEIGGDYRNISNRPTHNDTNPIWSPDGSRLAYRALGDSVQFIFLQAAGQAEVNIGRYENVFIRDMQWMDNQTLSLISNYSGKSAFCTLDILSSLSHCSEPQNSMFSLSWRPR